MTVDKDDYNGVLASPKGRDEVDLMKLVLHKPVPDNGGNVTLTVAAGSVVLWSEFTHQNKLTLNNGSITFPTTELEKTIWVELTAPSTTLRDVTLTLTYGGATDTVKATGIWATQTGFRNTNLPTTTTAPVSAGGTTINVLGGTFVAGDHIVILSPFGAIPQHSPEGYDVLEVDGTNLILSPVLASDWPSTSQVRLGMSKEIDNRDMIDSFVKGGGKLGSAHVSPRANNAMEMQFTVGPPGIGDEPGIKFDITRQKESIC